MKIITCEMPLKEARERSMKWWVKNAKVEFIYNATRTKARLIIEVKKADRAIKQRLLMSMLPRTERGQKLSQCFKIWVNSQKRYLRTNKQSYISDYNMIDFVTSKPDYNFLGGINQDFGEDARRAGF